jgi:hypothetical protein
MKEINRLRFADVQKFENDVNYLDKVTRAQTIPILHDLGPKITQVWQFQDLPNSRSQVQLGDHGMPDTRGYHFLPRETRIDKIDMNA